MDTLKFSNEMSKLCCISNPTSLLINEAKKLMKGSVHEDGFYIFNDGLVLLTEKETIDLMKHNSYLPIWLLPCNGLQVGAHYAGRTVCNSLKFIPLDNSINRDILHSLHIHSVLRCYILDGY